MVLTRTCAQEDKLEHDTLSNPQPLEGNVLSEIVNLVPIESTKNDLQPKETPKVC